MTEAQRPSVAGTWLDEDEDALSSFAAGGSANAARGAVALMPDTAFAPLPSYSNQQIADFLTEGYWGGRPHAFGTQTITYNVQGLTSAGRILAETALKTWAASTGLNFVATTGSAQLTFDDNQSGAFASASWSGTTTNSARVNVSTAWLSSYGTEVGTYSFQTYIHEIGHALGLGHAGDYNGSAGWDANGAGDNHYLNDSWQATVMSYFSQDENTAVNASYAYVIGPMMADIVAIQDLYGVPTTTNAGATVYGFGNTAAGYFDFGKFAEGRMVAFTIFDGGGSDTLDASRFAGTQKIDLRAGTYSNIGGETGNIGIATNTVIEKAVGGAGSDTMVGNAARNVLIGSGGNDTIGGGLELDILTGGAGRDSFVFDTTQTTPTRDMIRDFSAVDDTIRLDDAIFGELAAGQLDATVFKVIGQGFTGVDRDDHVLYDQSRGFLYYDTNGNLAGGLTVIAYLENKAAISASDFVVY